MNNDSPMLMMMGIYRKISNIRRTKRQNFNDSHFVLKLSLPNPLKPGFSRKWRCSWSSADKRCSNCIWVINNLFVCYRASHIKDLTVVTFHRSVNTILQNGPGGNVYELLNLTALKFSTLNKMIIFQCMGEIFCVEFQREPLKSTQNISPIHWKFDFYTKLKF